MIITNVYRELARFLNDNNIENYSIGQHQGRCERPCVVIEDGGQIRETKYILKVRRLNLTVMFPKGRYSEVEDYINKVATVMEGYNKTVFTEYVSDIMLDLEKDAYIAVLEYKIYIGV